MTVFALHAIGNPTGTRMIEIIRGDITKLAVDAIVNAANSALAGGGGVDGAIHRAAGPDLMRELSRYDGCPTGGAVLTKGYHLPARYVIHAVGPVWHGGSRGEPELLAKAYESSFARAREAGDVRSIAFPAISTGVYGYPKPAAAAIAVRVMRAHEDEFARIVACMFDAENLSLYTHLLGGNKTENDQI
ncbi:MAG TPA: O-acetyl-ADP-ribose deacetylase [Gemmatimonadaceae bacterium]|nr:O-acetyl-ADP-ribose deacetylase [Gemmatimonadaceae bacterium]